MDVAGGCGFSDFSWEGGDIFVVCAVIGSFICCLQESNGKNCNLGKMENGEREKEREGDKSMDEPAFQQKRERGRSEFEHIYRVTLA